jgi:hypothetical protein
VLMLHYHFLIFCYLPKSRESAEYVFPAIQFSLTE